MLQDSLRNWGVLVIIVAIIVLAVAFGSDTSVPSGSGDGTRIHNIGLMQNQRNLVILGTAILIVGAILVTLGGKNQAAVEQQAVDSGDMRKCPYCAELIKAEAIKCRFCGSELEKEPPKDSHHVEPSQETPEAASPPTMMCSSCGASIFPTQGFCDVCSATISTAQLLLKAATQHTGDTSKAGGETWHLILDHRVAKERREIVNTTLRTLTLAPTVTEVNEQEVKIASGATLQQANALMVRLHELGVISRKQRD